jgi:hypothetical protein
MCGELVTRGGIDGRLKAEIGDKELGITVEMEEITVIGATSKLSHWYSIVCTTML